MKQSTQSAHILFPLSAAFSVVVLTLYMNLRVLDLGWYGLLLSLTGMACLYVVGHQLFQNRWAGLFSAYAFMLTMFGMYRYGSGDFYIMSLVPFACLSLGQGIMMGFRALSRMGVFALTVGTLVFMFGNIMLMVRID